MPIFKTISEKQAKGKVKKIFDEIKRSRKIKKMTHYFQNFLKKLLHCSGILMKLWV